ncbi:hypothetical protein [Bradyrhizobium yuanmingense]|uniref:hypothetical protein n=1 Tax=Bradyrhizobium yuanmingense TaxID=108015 RepID=UPI0023B92A5F|nr:hypothetical protein [Bradyrhizobium yuanmingense]MDF0585059.1 hypothetical protein [Bradyrhizobium yuanmingense]
MKVIESRILPRPRDDAHEYELDFAALVERNATYTPGKTTIHVELKTPSYVILDRHIERIARAFESYFGVQRGDRRKILSVAGDIGRFGADRSFPLHASKTTPDYLSREYPSNKNSACAYGTTGCRRTRLVGRPYARPKEVPVAHVTRPPGARIEPEALIAHVWSTDHFSGPRKIIYLRSTGTPRWPTSCAFANANRHATELSIEIGRSSRALLSHYIADDIEAGHTHHRSMAGP